MKRGELDSLIKLASLSVHLSKSTYHSSASNFLDLSQANARYCSFCFNLPGLAQFLYCVIPFCCRAQGGHLGLEQPGKCSPAGRRDLSQEQNV